ncbi:MAG: flagellar export chaperone FliS [Treponema sp.]|nr:MAG: flagellar export chaperone FliS [Treponema sp.]
MSYNNRALNTYKETSVKTASQSTLIIMLYDEAIKQVGYAIDLLNSKEIKPQDIEKVNRHIIKTQDIVTELMASLDMEAGGEIAGNLLSIYSFFNQQLLQANVKKESPPLINVKSMMEELRAAWQEVAGKTSGSGDRPVSTGINIAG